MVAMGSLGAVLAAVVVVVSGVFEGGGKGQTSTLIPTSLSVRTEFRPREPSRLERSERVRSSRRSKRVRM